MHKAIREGDEMACTCGLRWDINEDDPHFDHLNDVGPHTGYELDEDPVSELERIRKELIEQGAHVTDDPAELADILGMPTYKPTCYQCDGETDYLFPDSRCHRCTRLTPEEMV